MLIAAGVGRTGCLHLPACRRRYLVYAPRAASSRGGGYQTNRLRESVKTNAIRWGAGGAAAEKAAETARQAAAAAEAARSAAHVEAVLRSPLWGHAVLCASSLVVVLGAAAWISHRLFALDQRHQDEEHEAVASADVQQTPKSPLQAGLLALHRPAAYFIPLAATLVSLRNVRRMLEAVAIHGQREPQAMHGLTAHLARNATWMLTGIDLLVREGIQLACIAFGVWSLLRLKELVIKRLMDQTRRDSTGAAVSSNPGQERALERVVLPLSGLSSWLVVLAGAIMALQVLGINVQPLLTVTGVSGLIVGLSAQSVMANMISGINLFLSRPFVVGDRIDVTTGGGAKMLTGYVERVDPMRTIIRSDAGLPFMLPNKVLADMIISNESRIIKSKMIATYDQPRQYINTLNIRLQDVDKLPDIISDIRCMLDGDPGVDKRLAYFCGLAGFDDNACNLLLVVHTSPRATRDFGNFRQNLLFRVQKLVAARGGALTFPTQVNLIPQLDKLHSLIDSPPAVSSNSSNGSGSSNGSKGDMMYSEG